MVNFIVNIDRKIEMCSQEEVRANLMHIGNIFHGRPVKPLINLKNSSICIHYIFTKMNGHSKQCFEDVLADLTVIRLTVGSSKQVYTLSQTAHFLNQIGQQILKVPLENGGFFCVYLNACRRFNVHAKAEKVLMTPHPLSRLIAVSDLFKHVISFLTISETCQLNRCTKEVQRLVLESIHEQKKCEQVSELKKIFNLVSLACEQIVVNMNGAFHLPAYPPRHFKTRKVENCLRVFRERKPVNTFHIVSQINLANGFRFKSTLGDLKSTMMGVDYNKLLELDMCALNRIREALKALEGIVKNEGLFEGIDGISVALICRFIDLLDTIMIIASIAEYKSKILKYYSGLHRDETGMWRRMPNLNFSKIQQVVQMRMREGRQNLGISYDTIKVFSCSATHPKNLDNLIRRLRKWQLP